MKSERHRTASRGVSYHVRAFVSNAYSHASAAAAGSAADLIGSIQNI